MKQFHPLSRIEKAFWLNEMVHESHNHVLVAFQTSLQVDIRVVENALKLLIDETPQFRSVITEDNGEPVWMTSSDYDYPITTACYQDEDVEQEIEKMRNESITLLSTSVSQKSDYPCRFRLLKGQHHHLLLFLFHHIVMEDSSMQLFCKRLSLFYNSLLAGRQIQLRESHYFDFALQEAELYRQNNVASDIAFWNDYVENGQLEKVHSYFPSIYAANHITTHRFSFGALQPELSALCSLHQLSPFRLLAAAWAVTVLKVFGNKQLFINYPITLRPQQMMEDIGVFVNDQLLRVSTEDHTTFSDVVEAVTIARRQSRPHQYLSLTETRVSDIMRSDDSTIAFNYPLGLEQVCLQLGDEHVPLYLRPLTYMPSSLQLDVEKEMSYGLVYTNPAYPNFFAEVLSKAFLQVLHQATKNYNIALSDLIIHDECLTKTLTASMLNAPAISAAPLKTGVAEQFAEQAAKHPDTVAVIFEQERLTYAQLNHLSDFVADEILRAMGHRHDSVFIGVYTHRSIHTIALLLGVLKAGYAIIPMDPQYTAERLSFIIEDSGMSLVITDDDSASFPVKSLNIDWSRVGDSNKEGMSVTAVERSEYAYMIYTSGTTGQPKGTPISQRSLLSLVNARQQSLPFDDHHVELCFGSISFDASVWSIYPVLLSGATVCLATDEQRHDPQQLLQVLQKERVSSVLLPPTIFTYLPYTELPHLKYLITGGDTCPKETIELWMRTTSVINAYGPTENTVVSTMHVFKDGSVCSTNIGKPLDGVDCYVLDEHLHPVPDGVKGTLYLGGVQLTSGYWNRPELNSKKFTGTPVMYDTGDIVCRMPDGDFLFYGRKDSQVKIRGFRIELSEIENCLLRNPYVKQCLVSVHRQNHKKYLAAYIGTDAETLLPSYLKIYLAATLPAYMIPELWHIAPALPMNTSGKIDRSAIASLPLERGEAADTEETLNEDELKCLSILSKVTDTPNLHINLDTDLIDELGLNSLAVLELSFLLSQRGYEVKATDIYRQRTLRQLAAYIGSDESSRKLTPQQIDARLCYLATPDDPQKPLLLIICGYRYYEVNYGDLHHALKDRYTILVLESVIEMKSYRPECVTDATVMIDEYVRLLRPYLERRRLDAVTGLCIGGDLALQLAVRLKELSLSSPYVFNIDGMAYRPDYKGQMGVMRGRGIDEEQDRQRRDFTISLARTIPQRYYDGRCVLFLATKFEDVGNFTSEQAQAFYPVNLCNWQKAQPQARIVFLSEVHMSLIHLPETLRIIRQTIDEELHLNGSV